MHIRTCAASGADDHGDSGLDAMVHEHFQILIHGHAADDCDTGPQLMRTCIGGTSIHHDGIRMLRNTAHEGFLRKSIPQNTARRKNFQLVTHERSLLSF